MKKSLLIIVALISTLSLTAFSYLNLNRSEALDLVYNIDSRFDATITKEKLNQVRTVAEIVPIEAEWSKVDFLNMTVGVLAEDGEKLALGNNGTLNFEQTTLLKDTDYSTNFFLKGKGKRKGDDPLGWLKFDYNALDYTYFLTIIPEKEAAYTEGKEALIAHLKLNSLATTSIIREDRLQPCQIHFTVSKTGAIEQVYLGASSGYPSVDKALVKLIENLPKKWTPAENAKGEQVDQELVFFFGRQGC